MNEAQKIVLEYCNAIIRKKIPAGMYVHKAVKRFMNDIDAQKMESRDYVLDWDIVQKFYDFTKLIKLTGGGYLKLLPWQLFIHANLIGWRYKHKKSKLRFRSGAVFVPRKNGKTTGLMYPLLLWDFLTTPSSESYFFEKDERQAAKMMNDLRTICKNTQGIKDIIDDTGTNIYYKNSKISYFSSETAGIDGYCPSIAIIDEYFCFQSDRPVTAMRYGSRARENGLVLIITTAGTDISLPAYNEDEKVRKILNGLLTDDTYFGIIYNTDEGDDWKKPEAYVKANPSIDVIIDRKILEQDLQDALGQPSHQCDYKAKTLNIWSNDVSNWIPLQKWDTKIRNTVIDIHEFEGMNCYAGLDLSAINDFTAYTKCFYKDGRFYLFHKFYIPGETIAERYKSENINIKQWVESGIITAIDGPVIDYGYIEKDIVHDNEKYCLCEVAYDRWQSNKLIDKLDEIIPKTLLIDYEQNLKQMSGPTKEFERLIYEDKIIDSNPVMKWMISCATIKIDVNGNYKPLKEYKSSNNRIDGVITSIMALSRCTENGGTTATKDFNKILSLF